MTYCYIVLFDVWMTTDAAEQPTRYPVPVEAFNALDATLQASVRLQATLGLDALVAGGVRLPKILDVRPDVDGEHEKLKAQILAATRDTPSEKFVRKLLGETPT
jgi:hypothetical protein